MRFVPDRSVSRGLREVFDAGAVGGLTDGQLLERFAARGSEASEAAFAMLVDRHGPMVLRVARAIVGDEHGAHDVFQATFLVLVRRSRSLWVRESLAPWLHRVARRIAGRARARADRRKVAERRAAETRKSERYDDHHPDDAAAILHEEIDRLPDHYRLPIVCCDLCGRTYEDVARSLQLPVGTIKSRLSRGRERLRERLSRRGLAPVAALAATIVAGEASAAGVPRRLLDVTVQAGARIAGGRGSARGLVSSSVEALMRGALTMMYLTKLTKTAGAVMALALAAVGAGVVAHQAIGERPAAPAAATPAPQGDVEKELMRLQRQWAVAVVNQDRGSLDQILADDFVVTGPTGHVSSRQEILDMVAGGVSQVESLEVDNMIVHVYPSAAVILGRSTYKTRPARADLAGSYRWTNTYVRIDGRWRCIAAQEGSRVAPPAAADGATKFDVAPLRTGQSAVPF